MEINNDPNVVTLKMHGNAFQTKCISALISDREFLEQIVDILFEDYFEMDAHRWIIRKIVAYFLKYKELPTFDVFKVEINSIPETQDVLKNSVFEEVRKAYSHISDTDVKYVKEQFLTFCKQQKLRQAILKSADYLNQGKYDDIKREIDAALRAGIERNLGHEYLTSIESRMSLMARTCVKTGWGIIDQRLDGGLGKGELGFIVAPAGSGKCVGSNTEIEISYYEIGIPIQGNSGKEYIIWIKPFEIYDMGDELGCLFGWQIDSILTEPQTKELK